MKSLRQCEFFVIRYVPDIVKGEWTNIGVVVLEAESGFADVRFTRDWRRAKCLDATFNAELFEALEADIRARLADVTDRQTLLTKLPDWASNALQLSPSTAVLTESPEAELGRLAEMYLESRRRGARERSGRQIIFGQMRDTFEQYGVWDHMRKRIAASQYTHRGDPLRIDCGYRPNGVIRMFHAVSLATDIDAAKVLAFSFPQLREGIARLENAKSELTAIIEDDLDREDESVGFALNTFVRTGVQVATVADLARIAETARTELRL